MNNSAGNIRTLVVDDEPLARALLCDMIAAEPGIELAGEAGDGAEAARLIREVKPDLVFLDVQMPDADGFALLELLEPEEIPAIIFVTAYDRYAIRAFEVHALDYILKPYDEARFRSACEHAVSFVRSRREPRVDERFTALLEYMREHREYARRLAVKQDARIILVDVDEIRWIEAADKYLRLHVADGSHLMRGTIGGVEQQLDPAYFMRIHRSSIVNIGFVREIQPWFQNDYVVLLKDGTRLSTGRAYRDNLKRLIGG